MTVSTFRSFVLSVVSLFFLRCKSCRVCLSQCIYGCVCVYIVYDIKRPFAFERFMNILYVDFFSPLLTVATTTTTACLLACLHAC